MPEKYKMIGIDLDGTLLTSEKKFTQYSKDVLARAMDRGIVVLPVTGRPLSGIPEEIMQFPGIRYAITANGARVVDIAGDKVLAEELVCAETARKILDIFEQYDTLREIYYDGAGYAEEKDLNRIGHYCHDRPMAEYVKNTRTAIPDVRKRFEEENRGVDKMQAIFADMREQDAALDEISRISGIEVTGSLSNNIEVNALGVHKGRALLDLGRRLSISAGETVAFGDGSNDIRMLKAAGLGIAMGNAIPEARDAADAVTFTNDEDGVARAIESYVLN